ncbi:hypothetical protein [Thermococcus sp.]
MIAHYQNVIKSLQEDAKKYPKAAAGLEKSVQMYQQRIADLNKYLAGGEAPAWFARLMVHEVTSTDLARLPNKTKEAVNMKTGFYVPVNIEKEKERWLHPAPNPTVSELARNTGVKTVPSPKPPEKAKIVSVSQVKQGVDWRKVGLIVGILAGVYFLIRRR